MRPAFGSRDMNASAVTLSIKDGIGQLVLTDPPLNILTRAVL